MAILRIVVGLFSLMHGVSSAFVVFTVPYDKNGPGELQKLVASLIMVGTPITAGLLLITL